MSDISGSLGQLTFRGQPVKSLLSFEVPNPLVPGAHVRTIFRAILLFSCIACYAPSGWCREPDPGLKAIGVRGGFNATSRNDEFHQYEAFATFGLPWSLRGDSGWGVALQANASAGTLHAAGEYGFIGTAGPGVIIDRWGKGLGLQLGGDLCVLSQYKFRNVNFNGNPLFLGHIGLVYRFAAGPGILYRFQHMSNGGLGRHGDINTGLDLHMFGVSWNF